MTAGSCSGPVFLIAARIGGSGRYLSEQQAELVDCSHRPHSSPAQVADSVEAAVAEMRRSIRGGDHGGSGWNMLRKPGSWFSAEQVVPQERTIDRIPQRQGLLRSRPGHRLGCAARPRTYATAVVRRRMVPNPPA
jgi:hypothetical protein